MAKKLSLMLAVLAFAIPAVASASKATLPAGTLVPVLTRITTTGSDFILQSNLTGSITCEKLNLNGEITKNDGSTVEGSGNTTFPTQAGCKNGSKSVTVTSFNLTNFTSTVSGSATVSLTFVLDVGTFTCTFTGSKVPGAYVSGSNVLTFSAAEKLVGSPSACGTARLSASFALEQTGSENKLILD